jgi:predicted lipase
MTTQIAIYTGKQVRCQATDVTWEVYDFVYPFWPARLQRRESYRQGYSCFIEHQVVILCYRFVANRNTLEIFVTCNSMNREANHLNTSGSHV